MNSFVYRQQARHTAAWLALLAVWLIYAGPLLSRWQNLSRVAEPLACHQQSPAQSAPVKATHLHSSLSNACGYCSLLADQPGLGTLPGFICTPLTRSVRLSLNYSLLSCIAAYSLSQPRAPPALIHLTT